MNRFFFLTLKNAKMQITFNIINLTLGVFFPTNEKKKMAWKIKHGYNFNLKDGV